MIVILRSAQTRLLFLHPDGEGGRLKQLITQISKQDIWMRLETKVYLCSSQHDGTPDLLP